MCATIHSMPGSFVAIRSCKSSAWTVKSHRRPPYPDDGPCKALRGSLAHHGPWHKGVWGAPRHRLGLSYAGPQAHTHLAARLGCLELVGHAHLQATPSLQASLVISSWTIFWTWSHSRSSSPLSGLDLWLNQSAKTLIISTSTWHSTFT